MTIDWSCLLTKKRSLGQPDPTPAELAAWESRAGKLLGVEQRSYEPSGWAESLGYGMRTLALITPYSGVEHRFSSRSQRVVLKLFRSQATEHIQFHSHTFLSLPILQRIPLQASLAGGEFDGCGYAVLQFIPGITLRQAVCVTSPWTGPRAVQALNDLMESIWIPAWASGLRFKDCHPGNFILSETTGRLVMIDGEQMRKPATELIDSPSRWLIRDRHEDNAFSRLPKLISDTLYAAGTETNRAALNRAVAQAIEDSHLVQHLKELGRTDHNQQDVAAATSAWRSVLSQLRMEKLC